MRLALVLAVALAACSRPPPEPVPPKVTAEEALQKRLACEHKAGATAAETLSTDSPKGDQIPLEHFVLVMQENRSFDHYFSKLSHGGVRVAPADVTNPDRNGNPVARFHLDTYCVDDPSHGWPASHTQNHDGKNDGFVVGNSGVGERALGYYDESDLPYYYALARTFALSDAHFASVMGPTQPNRLYYYAGTSFGTIANTIPPLNDENNRPYPNLFTRLNQAKVTWKVYSTNLATPAVFLNVLSDHLERFEKVEDFFTDLSAGNLPQVSIVEAAYGEGVAGGENDEHSPSNVQLGQKFTSEVINAVMASSAWPKTVVFLSYDEHGGYYDSVPPGKACEPDALTPIGDDTRKFDHYGFRVPLIAISPYARRGYVSHVVSDHTSVMRFLAAKFGLKALTARDANADALLDLFDFEHPDLSVPSMPAAAVDAAKVDRCHLDFP